MNAQMSLDKIAQAGLQAFTLDSRQKPAGTTSPGKSSCQAVVL